MRAELKKTFVTCDERVVECKAIELWWHRVEFNPSGMAQWPFMGVWCTSINLTVCINKDLSQFNG